MFMKMSVAVINAQAISPIIIVLMQGEQEGQWQQYQSARDREVRSIRKQNRSELLWKRRLVLENQGGETKCEQKNESREGRQLAKYVFLDDRFREEIVSCLKRVLDNGMLAQFVQNIKDKELRVKLRGLIGIRRLTTFLSDPPIQQIIESGILDLILELGLQKEQAQLQLEAIWTLANLSFGNQFQTQVIVERGVVGLFYLQLYSGHPKLVEISLMGLGNIACEPAKHIILAEGYCSKIMAVVRQQYQSRCCKTQNGGSVVEANLIVQYGCWTLANICRGSGGVRPAYNQIKEIIPLLLLMVERDCIADEDIYVDCLFALSYHCVGDNHNLQEVLESKILQRLVAKLTGFAESKAILPALRIMGNVVVNCETVIEHLLQISILPLLLQCLGCRKQVIRRESCWVLSNIAASEDRIITVFCNHKGLMGKLVQMFMSDCDEVRREISFVFANLTACTTALNLDRMYVDSGVIDGYVELMQGHNLNGIVAGLKNLFAVLKKSQRRKSGQTSSNLLVEELQRSKGVQILQKLQYHKSNAVYNWVSKIMKRFFVTCDEQQGINDCGSNLL